MNCAFPFDDRALGMLLALPGMPFDHLDPFDNDPAFAAQNADHFAALAPFRAGKHHDFISPFDM
jgi:hypothetical protein